MPWPLRFLPNHDPGDNTYQPQVGDCYYADGARFSWSLDHMGDNYKRDWADKRPPIVVWLPPGFPFWVDLKPSDGDQTGWTVTGSIEDGTLTVAPSISCPPDYHGFIQNGVITDDVEGRTY
jgi:hypothetical protein